MEPEQSSSIDVPTGDYSTGVPSSIVTAALAAPAPKDPAPQSKYRGVCWVRANQKWKAQITIDGKQAYLGLFENEEEAARKVDEHAAGLGRPSNFASAGKKKVSTPATVTSVPANSAVQRDPAPQSKYRGVSWIRANQKWKAQITIDGKQTYLGLFESEVEAAFAYDEHASAMGKPVNFATQEGQKQATPSKRKRLADADASATATLVPLPPSVVTGMGPPILPNPVVATAPSSAQATSAVTVDMPASTGEAVSNAPAVPPSAVAPDPAVTQEVEVAL